MRPRFKAEVPCQVLQTVARSGGERPFGHAARVQDRARGRNMARSNDVGRKEPDVERRVVRHRGALAQEAEKRGKRILDGGRALDHLVRDPVDPGGDRRDGNPRVHELLKALLRPCSLEGNSRQLDDAVHPGDEAGGFKIERHVANERLL